MPQTIRAVVVDAAAPGRLALKPVELRDPDRDEVGVRVTAISLNRGETRRALQVAEPGWRPGWDFAGVVESEAADGTGPKPGTRVVGLLPSGAWAERVNCRGHAVAALPDAVSDAEAATLPVAGLTALHALHQGGLLLGRKVLIDGASGGVGHLACQLAAAAGALVWGHVRREEHRAAVEACGARAVLGRDLGAAKPHGPFWLIVDSLGASATGAALGMLQPNGTCVTFGVSEGPTATFESRGFFGTGGVKLYGLTPRADERRARRHRLAASRRADRGEEIATADHRRGALGRDRHDRPAPHRPRIRRQGRPSHPLKLRGGGEDVDLAIGEEVARLAGISLHMRRGGMRLQMIEALPLLDDDKGIGAVFGARPAFGIDRGTVFDAARLGVDGRHVGAEMAQHFVAFAGFGSDDGDNMNHGDMALCFRQGDFTWQGRQDRRREKRRIQASRRSAAGGFC